MRKRKVLFVERDEEIRDLIAEHILRNADEVFHLHSVKTLVEAEGACQGEKFDGLVIDTLQPSKREILAFIRKMREQAPNLSIIALVGYADMILDDELKEDLKRKKVSIIDKLEALKPDRITKLFEASCSRGYGEEL